MADAEAHRAFVAIVKATIEAAGELRRLERFAEERFGANSSEHNMVREQLAIILGADLGEYEDRIAEAEDEEGLRLEDVVRLKESYDLPSVDSWDTFWPAQEAREYAQLVRRAGKRWNGRLRKDLAAGWQRLTEAAARDLGPEFADVPAPDWLDD